MDMVWRDDGHVISVRLSENKFIVDLHTCPFEESSEAACYLESIDGCLVRWFIDGYGVDCNVGEVEVVSPMTIAWSKGGSGWEADLYQIHTISVDDPHFKEWAEALRTEAAELSEISVE